MDWAVYGALAFAGVSTLAATGFVAVRALQGWRSFKRFRRRVGRELDRLAELAGITAEQAPTAGHPAQLDESLARLRVTLARFAVLQEAFDEATAAFRRVTAVYPRK
jgi:hypothetical protein